VRGIRLFAPTSRLPQKSVEIGSRGPEVDQQI